VQHATNLAAEAFAGDVQRGRVHRPRGRHEDHARRARLETRS
jgi:hypothetical protein